MIQSETILTNVVVAGRVLYWGKMTIIEGCWLKKVFKSAENQSPDSPVFS